MLSTGWKNKPVLRVASKFENTQIMRTCKLCLWWLLAALSTSRTTHGHSLTYWICFWLRLFPNFFAVPQKYQSSRKDAHSTLMKSFLSLLPSFLKKYSSICVAQTRNSQFQQRNIIKKAQFSLINKAFFKCVYLENIFSFRNEIEKVMFKLLTIQMHVWRSLWSKTKEAFEIDGIVLHLRGFVAEAKPSSCASCNKESGLLKITCTFISLFCAKWQAW